MTMKSAGNRRIDEESGRVLRCSRSAYGVVVVCVCVCVCVCVLQYFPTRVLTPPTAPPRFPRFAAPALPSKR